MQPGTIVNQGGWKIAGDNGEGDAEDYVVVNDRNLAFKGPQCLSIAGRSGRKSFLEYYLKIQLNEAKNYLFGCCIRFDQPGKNGLYISIGTNRGGEYAWHTSVNNRGEILYSIREGNADGYKMIASGAKISAGKWYRVQYRVSPRSRSYNFRVDENEGDLNLFDKDIPTIQKSSALNDLYVMDLVVEGAAGNNWLIDDIRFAPVPAVQKKP